MIKIIQGQLVKKIFAKLLMVSKPFGLDTLPL